MYFSNLKVLNLNFNHITELVYVPENLEELYLAGNQVDTINLAGPI
jgi:Leucine-rich repeat (LRR) protein